MARTDPKPDVQASIQTVRISVHAAQFIAPHMEECVAQVIMAVTQRAAAVVPLSIHPQGSFHIAATIVMCLAATGTAKTLEVP